MQTYTYVSKGKFELTEKPKPVIMHERDAIVKVTLAVSVVSGSGVPEYVSDPSTGLSDYMANAGNSENDFKAGTTRLIRLEKDEVASVEYWLYLEGCDEQCINEVQSKTSDIQLAFAGVEVE